LDFFQIPRSGQFFVSVFLKRFPEQAVLSTIKEPPNTGNYGPPSVCVLVSVGSLWVFICWKTQGKRCNAGRRDQTMSMDISVIFSWWNFAIFWQKNSETYVFQMWIWLIFLFLGEMPQKFWYPKNEKKYWWTC
jgi:hypothetical protein